MHESTNFFQSVLIVGRMTKCGILGIFCLIHSFPCVYLCFFLSMTYRFTFLQVREEFNLKTTLCAFSAAFANHKIPQLEFSWLLVANAHSRIQFKCFHSLTVGTVVTNETSGLFFFLSYKISSCDTEMLWDPKCWIQRYQFLYTQSSHWDRHR